MELEETNWIEKLTLDKEFIRWVQKPTRDLKNYWGHYLEDHPERAADVAKARMIIRSFTVVEDEISDENLNNLWTRISQSRLSSKTRKVMVFFRYAAVFAAVVCLAGIAFYLIGPEKPDYQITESTPDSRGKVVMPDGSVHYFDAGENTIHQLGSGKIALNEDTIAEKQHIAKPVDALIQIFVPYGKRMEITMYDGSKVWLNSGTRFSYPGRMNGRSREVFLYGEAFFDAAKNPEAPFYVNTRDLKVIVTGTKFNVSAYDDDLLNNTVLVEGSVKVQPTGILSKNIVLQPGEMATFIRENKTFFKDKADIDLYTSWVYGYLILDKVPISEVMKKLERYFNQTINVSDALRGVTLSGKVDLKDDLKVILDDLAFASSVKVAGSEDGSYYVRP
jgi:ferric-dicitrate binding protein FerR (iron transport regulator)